MSPIYFCSGASAPADLAGLSRIRHPLGVAIPQLSARVLDDLCALRGVCEVFVDTEAFSEVDRTGAVVAPISDAQWVERTRVMHRIAAALGEDAWIVVPDRVGDQQETLRRIALFEDVLRACAALGARLVVPIQRGGMSAPMFYDACCALLGVPFVVGVPGNKAAMPPHELEALLRSRRPRAVHLLGVGPKGDRFRPLVDACRRFGVSEVTCDSNGLAALVGRENGRGGGPRPLTAWQATMGDRADAIVMTLGPLRFFEAAMAEYRARGLAAERREAPLQVGLFDAVKGRAA